MVFNKISDFFSNKWTRFGFSFVSAGYLWFLGWVAWLTFAYNFVYGNAAALFLLYSFVNVMFAIAMIYTRKNIITKFATFFMHPFILILLIYGFGNWFLVVPPFITAAVIFFASGANESLKVILGTIYMILFVLAFLAYVTLVSLTIKPPTLELKMELNSRRYPVVEGANTSPHRLVAYVSESKEGRRTANYFVENRNLDKSMWNLTCERIYGSERVGTLVYCEDVFSSAADRNPSYVLEWISPGNRRQNYLLNFGGQRIEIDRNSKRVAEEGAPVSPNNSNNTNNTDTASNTDSTDNTD